MLYLLSSKRLILYIKNPKTFILSFYDSKCHVTNETKTNFWVHFKLKNRYYQCNIPLIISRWCSEDFSHPCLKELLQRKKKKLKQHVNRNRLHGLRYCILTLMCTSGQCSISWYCETWCQECECHTGDFILAWMFADLYRYIWATTIPFCLFWWPLDLIFTVLYLF